MSEEGRQTYFRCRNAEKQLALRRLSEQARHVFADLQPTSISIRRLPSREQRESSQQTEITLHFPCRRPARLNFAKPVTAIAREDLLAHVHSLASR